MAGKIATRNAYGEALAELADKYPQLVVLDADLAGATMSKFFAAAHPERFFDCGIAEANMTDIAAGLSTCGYKPFTNTFAIFAAGRVGTSPVWAISTSSTPQTRCSTARFRILRKPAAARTFRTPPLQDRRWCTATACCRASGRQRRTLQRSRTF